MAVKWEQHQEVHSHVSQCTIHVNCQSPQCTLMHPCLPDSKEINQHFHAYIKTQKGSAATYAQLTNAIGEDNILLIKCTPIQATKKLTIPKACERYIKYCKSIGPRYSTMTREKMEMKPLINCTLGTDIEYTD